MAAMEARPASQRSVNVRILKGGLGGAANAGDAGTAHGKNGSEASAKHSRPNAVGIASDGRLAPLQFLLGVMRAPNTPAHLRLRIAGLVAPYVHSKRAADGPPTIIVEDPTGFSIDPARAIELRDAKHRYDAVYTTWISQPEHWKREAAGLEAGIAEIQKVCSAHALPAMAKNNTNATRSGWRHCRACVTRA